jgi:hypothetical protein
VQDSDGITVYSFDLSAEEKTLFTDEPSAYDIPLGEVVFGFWSYC